jgi:hypothetical protein
MDKRQRFNRSVTGETIIPMQAFGLGDIIFCQAIAHHWRSLGYHVKWPVYDQFLDGLSLAYPSIEWVRKDDVDIDWDRKETHKHNGVTVVPLRWTYEILKVPYRHCMRSKYDYLSMDYHIWKKHAMWERDPDREQMLEDTINPGGEPFNLVNRTFKTDGSGWVDIQVNNGLPNIEMRQVDGFSLFDWTGLILKAREFHTVSTSSLYMVEVLRRPTHFYLRAPVETTHRNYDYLLSKIHRLH